MAEIEGSLWEHNFAKVLVLDVSDDYELMQDPMPAVCYPVITEKWVHKAHLIETLPTEPLAPGYLYDWHELSAEQENAYYVGVVRKELADALLLPEVSPSVS